jgi:Na+/proline symporter
VQYAFTGFAALSPLLVAALFWRGSTKWGALASTLWVVAGVAAVAVFQAVVPPPHGPPTIVWSLGGREILARTAGGTSVLGFMPVVPMVLVSALLMAVVSALTPKPSRTTLDRYFS